jgi:hypothetical protein
MRKFYNFILMATAVVMSISLAGQSQTNVQALHELAEEFSTTWEAQLERVTEYAKQHNVPVLETLPNGNLIQMIDVRDGIPIYRSADNRGCAVTLRTDRLWEGGSSGLELSGDGYDRLGEWDEGGVRTTHQEFTDQGDTRVTVKDGAPTSSHSTHVAGTLIAAGVNSAAQGMAYSAELDCYDWNNDNNEMSQAAADGMEISNHSYNFITGWYWSGGWEWSGNPAIDPNEDYRFGFYSQQTRALDGIVWYAPYYLPVRSAGNDRGEGPGGSGPENDGGPDGYDCIPEESIAKNIMTVGAVRQVTDYTGPESVLMSSFSSWGPADDGRIKPDIVGKGVSVFSTGPNADNNYYSSDGTSMSSPSVAGSMALLQHYHQELFGSSMLASTLKGLVLHTADEAGSDEGPDYRFGWGLMNSFRAAEVITKDTLQNLIDEIVMLNGEEYTREVTIPADSTLRVTICWTDPKGSPVNAQLNPRDPMLVHDLDLWVTNTAGSTFYPYSLDPDNPSAAATKAGKNNVDNVEMVFIPNTPPGTYTIHVGHDGDLEEGEQTFSLIVTGITDLPQPECVNNLVSPPDGSFNLYLNQLIDWDPATYATSYDVYFGTDGGGEETPTNVYNGENFEDTSFEFLLDPDTTYYIQILPRNDQGTNDSCSTIWSFSTMGSVETYPFNEQFSTINPPEVPFGYQVINNSEGEWRSNDFTGHGDNTSMILLHPEGLVETDFDDWLISMPFTVKGGEEYDVSVHYKNAVPGTDESMTVYWAQTPYTEDLTNTVFKDNSFDDNWLEGTGVMTPEEDGVAFLGFYIKTNDGYGVYIDDITVDGWTVGINPAGQLSDAKIYSYAGKIFVDAEDSWNGADLRIMNMMGQVIYQGKFIRGAAIDPGSKLKSGVYVVSLNDGGQQLSEKVLLK